MSTSPNPLVKLWMWIVRNRVLHDSDDAGAAGFLGFLLWAGPAFGLAVGGSQMAKHGVPVWLAIVVPLVVWLFCLHFLVIDPERKATTTLRAKSLEPVSIKAKTDLLRTALTEASNLSRDLEAQLNMSNASLERIEEKARVNKQLAAMDQEAADAVAHAWGQRAAEKERRYARVATLWAVIGIVATVLVGLLARYLAL